MPRKPPDIANPSTLPWERQPQESEPAWEAFRRYRDLGPQRSINEVGRALAKSGSLIDRWARVHQWRARITAYENHRDRARRVAARQRETKLTDDHLAAANALMIQALTRLRPTPVLDNAGAPILQPDGSPFLVPADAHELNAAANALDKAIKHQRLAVGLPTEVTKQDVMLREQVTGALEAQRIMRAILEEHICDDCRSRVDNELDRVAQHHAAIEEEARR